MRHSEREEAEFREFVAGRLDRLRNFAFLVCGDWHRAEDAVQVTLSKLYVVWPKTAKGSADAYSRRILINAVKDEWRRAWFRRERSTLVPPDAATADPAVLGAERIAVLSALAKLPTKQRAVVVLRFWEDRSVEQTAEIMRCSTGTVKSHTARGLQALRGLLEEKRSQQTEGVRR
ncbi:SigE family RNA polymerase sigma factor [Phytomonospora endophytica]|uniref:RNA polymerase sigma-70 factor (Sigma-E family) n=1 Tax=Phytomonospora endophytica TaxID=714109 RepID=A0A841FEA2_9ACTN|nr:SigE family RNA polymerase sigma factor [Phytomonospora endophytica]MBB6033343.1 RNA polymerase sigma-70 factor (sigma-E family) [Phytomonospora endophytica]GIG71508.1 RNA polymerase sigma24 factor [Phytomonospora endophytica]